jgi:uncharacterized protein YqfA (UPF0365 family)
MTMKILEFLGFNWVAFSVVAVIVIILVTLLVLVQPGLFFRAMISGTPVSVVKMIRMRMKHLDARMLVNNYIKARKSGVSVTMDQIENHAQSKGNVNRVIGALISAHNAGIDLSTKTAMAIDLAGRDIMDAVKHCITPKVIETDKIAAIAKDGIELSVKAKITIRTNLKRIIGGALEETIIARVCEGIVTTIGNASNHKELIENPDRISKNVLINRSISTDTAYDILSIDVADIDIGRNIGAELQIDEAEAIKYISQADAEKRRSEAIAAEQEMRALTQEMRARVVAAESELPRAIAEAFMRGNITVQDYYRMQNTLSDTDMRKAIAASSNANPDAVSTPVVTKKKTTLA